MKFPSDFEITTEMRRSLTAFIEAVDTLGASITPVARDLSRQDNPLAEDFDIAVMGFRIAYNALSRVQMHINTPK